MPFIQRLIRGGGRRIEWTVEVVVIRVVGVNGFEIRWEVEWGDSGRFPAGVPGTPCEGVCWCAFEPRNSAGWESRLGHKEPRLKVSWGVAERSFRIAAFFRLKNRGHLARGAPMN